MQIRSFALVVALVCVLSDSILSASTIPGPSTLASGVGCVSPTINSSTCSAFIVGANYNTSLPAGTGTAAVAGSASATYGVLRSWSSETYTGSTTPVFAISNTAADFLDDLTINASSLAGQIGYMTLGFTLDGTNSGGGSLNSEAYVNSILYLASGPVQTSSLGFTASSVSGTFSFPLTFSFVYGQAFGLYLNLGTIVGTSFYNSDGSLNEYTATTSGNGLSSFGDTLVLSSIQVFDSNMQPVQNPTFGSASGTVYSTNGVVPEPSTVALVLFACSSIVGMAHRRRKS